MLEATGERGLYRERGLLVAEPHEIERVCSRCDIESNESSDVHRSLWGPNMPR